MNRHIVGDLSRLRRQEGSKSIFAFAKLYLPHHLKCRPSAAHHEIYGLLERTLVHRGNKVAVAAPRDFGKSTLVTLFYVLYCLCYAKERFIVVVANTSAQAVQVLENVVWELNNNPLLRMDFPELFGPNGRLMRSRQGEIITANGIKVVALGSGQQIRGRRFGNARPGLVIVDDLESVESTGSEEARQKMKGWFEGAVLKVGAPETNYIFVGNLYHPYCLLAEYVDKERSPGWESLVYSAIISWPTSKLWDVWRSIRSHRSQYKGAGGPLAARLYYEDHKAEMNEGVVLLWPERYDICTLMELYEDSPLTFMSEFQNMPADDKICPFRLEEFRYWTDAYHTPEELRRALGENAEYFLACDPSTGESVTKGDYSAIAILVRDTKTEAIYLIKMDIRRRPLDELLGDILAYCKCHKFRKIGFESNNFQGLLISNLKKLLTDNGLHPEIVPIANTANKVKRISELLPLLKTGQLQLSRHEKLFLEQLQLFPRARHDDGPDAAEMVVRLCVETKNQVAFWFAGSRRHYPPQPGDLPPLPSIRYPTPEGLVPYGFNNGRRPY